MEVISGQDPMTYWFRNT